MKQDILNYLKEQVGADDADLLEALYAEYFNTVMEKVGELQAAIPAGDFEALRRIAHALKGNAAMVGDTAINQHALAFEMGAKSADIETCKTEFTQLQALASAMEN